MVPGGTRHGVLSGATLMMKSTSQTRPYEVNFCKRIKPNFKKKKQKERLQVLPKMEVTCWLSTVAKSTRKCSVRPGGTQESTATGVRQRSAEPKGFKEAGMGTVLLSVLTRQADGRGFIQI